MMNSTISANNIMSTNFCSKCCKCFKSLFAAILCRVMNDDKVGLAQIKIGSANPLANIIQRIFYGSLLYRFRQFLYLFFILFVGAIIRTTVARSKAEKK